MAKVLFKQLKNGDKFKTDCYQEGYFRKASERSYTDRANVHSILPFTEVIKFEWSD